MNGASEGTRRIKLLQGNRPISAVPHPTAPALRMTICPVEGTIYALAEGGIPAVGQGNDFR